MMKCFGLGPCDWAWLVAVTHCEGFINTAEWTHLHSTVNFSAAETMIGDKTTRNEIFNEILYPLRTMVHYRCAIFQRHNI
jgi:hypothetical protein